MGDSQVLKEAVIGYGEELALFAHPVQEVGVRGVHYVPIYPSNDYSNQGILEFTFNGTGSRYIDLRRTRLSLRCKIVKSDGSALPPRKNDKGEVDTASLVAPVSSLFSAMWERVDIELQGKSVTQADTTYPYLGYLKNLLHTPKVTKDTLLKSQLFYQDKASGMSNYNPSESDNPGLVERAKFIEGSRMFDMEGPLASDVCDIQKFIPHGVTMRFKFYPCQPAFFLMSPIPGNPDFAIKITRAVLNMCQVEVSREVLISHDEIMQNKMAFFPYMQTQIKPFLVPSGSFFHEISDPFLNTVPSSLTLGLVTEKSRNGDLTANPFKFIHSNLSYIQVTVDGVEIACYEPTYSDKPEKGLYMPPFNALHSLDEDIGIDRLDFPNGYCLYHFSIDPSLASVAHDADLMPLKRKGNLRIVMKFSKKIDQAMTLIAMARFPAALKLDRSRVLYTT